MIVKPPVDPYPSVAWKVLDQIADSRNLLLVTYHYLIWPTNMAGFLFCFSLQQKISNN